MAPQSVHMVVRKDLFKQKSSAFVSFSNDTADTAVHGYLAMLDGAVFDGNILTCQLALPPSCLEKSWQVFSTFVVWLFGIQVLGSFWPSYFGPQLLDSYKVCVETSSVGGPSVLVVPFVFSKQILSRQAATNCSTRTSLEKAKSFLEFLRGTVNTLKAPWILNVYFVVNGHLGHLRVNGGHLDGALGGGLWEHVESLVQGWSVGRALGEDSGLNLFILKSLFYIPPPGKHPTCK